eukprot:649922-Rhodomonas_salina.1
MLRATDLEEFLDVDVAVGGVFDAHCAVCRAPDLFVSLLPPLANAAAVARQRAFVFYAERWQLGWECAGSMLADRQCGQQSSSCIAARVRGAQGALMAARLGGARHRWLCSQHLCRYGVGTA